MFVGFVVLSIGYFMGRQHRKFRKRGVPVKARVIDFKERQLRDDEDGTITIVRSPILEVVDGPHAGAREEDFSGTANPVWREGLVVDALYDPKAERLVSTVGQGDSQELSVVFLLAGGGLVIASLLS